MQAFCIDSYLNFGSMKKMVVKLSMHDEREKKKAMKAVSGISGIRSLALDMTDQKLTITGDMDPVDVVAKLRKNWGAEIVSFGPPEDEPKKEDARKEDDDEKKKKTEAEQIEDLIKATKNCYPYHPSMMPQPYNHAPQPENPNTCVIS